MRMSENNRSPESSRMVDTARMRLAPAVLLALLACKLILLVLATEVVSAEPVPPPKDPVAPTLVGRWRVVGCATSPRDPADCARGKIVFEAKRWAVDLACCKRARAYVIVSTAPDRITISSEGERSEIVIDADGRAQWIPGGLGGRVGTLSFVRDTR